MENKKSFVLYSDLIYTVKKMSKSDAGELFVHILEYVNDLNPTTDNLIVELTFEPVKQQLKRDLAKWDGIKTTRSEIGKLGGLKSGEIRKSKQNEANEAIASKTKQIEANASKTKQTQANEAVSVNVNVSVSDNVNDNVNVINNNNLVFLQKTDFKKFTKNDFIEDIQKNKSNYSSEMLRSFLNYWSETDSKGKMKFQLQKTWETSKRLVTWANNNFGTKQNQIDQNKESLKNASISVMEKLKSEYLEIEKNENQ